MIKSNLIPVNHNVYSKIASDVLYKSFPDLVAKVDDDDSDANLAWSAIYETAMYLERSGLNLSNVLPLGYRQ